MIGADTEDMTDADARELEAAVALARRLPRRPAMPAVGLGLRLRTSPQIRALLPTALVIRRAAAKGRAAWRNASDREGALATMDAILANTPRAGEVEELARRRLVESEAQRALYWQPWRTVSVDPTSASNLQRALSCERGVLLSSCHLGPYFLQMSALSSSARRPFAVSAPWFFEDPTPDYWGRRLARWRRGIYARDERLVCSAGSFPVVKAMLEDGEIVLSYFDMPGGTTTEFLGKPVMLSSGTAQLAFQTKALVVPLRARRAGSRVWTDVFEPLDPRDFGSVDELHRAVAAVHERSILELPETLEDPGRAGAWENGATASGWAPGERGRPRPPAHMPAERPALGAD
jgi:lauroyl/myristoyl acyltransferase